MNRREKERLFKVQAAAIAAAAVFASFVFVFMSLPISVPIFP